MLPLTVGSGKDMRQALLAMIMFAVPERVQQEEVSGSRSGMFRFRMGTGSSFFQGEECIWLEAATETGGNVSFPFRVSGFSGDILIATGPFSGVSGRKSILVEGPSLIRVGPLDPRFWH